MTRPGTTALSGTINYTYDGLRRLTTAIYPPSTNSGDTITYTYDAMSNRTAKTSVNNGTTPYAVDDTTNRMSQAGNYYFDYDSCGNWTRKWHTTDEGSVVDIYFSYDYENRLTDARGPGGDPYYMTNTYNGDGVRLSKATNADLEKRYVYDGMNTVVEQDASGYLRYKYVYVNGMLLSRIDASDNKSYYHHDGLGSIIGVSNSAPEILTAQLFDEFGNWLYFDSDWDYYGYTGQEYDWTLMDAVNLRAREYYPEYGRFMQEDPIGNRGGSLNWYLYVANNPINAVDLHGLYIIDNSYDKYLRQKLLTTQGIALMRATITANPCCVGGQNNVDKILAALHNSIFIYNDVESTYRASCQYNNITFTRETFDSRSGIVASSVLHELTHMAFRVSSEYLPKKYEADCFGYK
ncbi:hypothetical protein HZA73_09765 [candidate division TA06 bacterium]|nr:hypothetical protein [candidate division TA06 bacterium]